MTNLSSFAELIKKATDEKRIREAAEAERKVNEVSPLLSDLFATISKGKEVKKAILEKELPLLAELEDALANPDKLKSQKQEKKDRIVELVAELEEKAEEIQTRVDTSPEPKEVVTDLEKKFLKLFNRLQNDFQTLKKHVEKNGSSSSSAYGGGGSGEVRILRMDDIDISGLQNGATLVWNSSLNKFVMELPSSSPGTDEDMAYATRIDFVTDDLIYKGEAPVGSSDSAPVWRIHRLVIGSDSDVTETWANGSSGFVHIWANRLALNYS